MPQMNKENFVKFLNELVSLKEDADAVHKALRKFDPDFGFFSLGRYETLVVKLLETAANDKAEWVSYWLYEKECGKRRNMTVSDKKGNKLKSTTPEDVWELIKRK
jgi:hypothetical protein